MKISYTYVIYYLPNVDIKFFNNYREKNPTLISIKSKVKLANIERGPPPSVGITKPKVNNAKSLLKYLDSEGHTFFTEYFSSILNDRAVDDNVILFDED